ncbi:MAG TPA: dihydrofolate reductase family protein [Candidatus Limnocylindrales bacterium]|nr:dihydrofolate reductase family protein [Candidatus Limnocylindrales bacterium]
MSKVVVFMNLTLDGVMQAPGRPDEDRRGGFEYGGWAVPYADQEMGKVATESMATTGGLLFGRRTYEDFYSVWPKRTDGNPFTTVLNNTPKYVASTTLEEPLPWVNSTLLQGDATEAVDGLKRQPGKDLVILGSGELVRSLMRRNLIDTYVLQIHPLLLGAGRRLFSDVGPYAALRLVNTRTTTTGVIIATYEPALTSTNKS